MKIKITETGEVKELVHCDVQYNGEDFTADVLEARYDKSIEQDDDGVWYMTEEQYQEYVDALARAERGEDIW